MPLNRRLKREGNNGTRTASNILQPGIRRPVLSSLATNVRKQPVRAAKQVSVCLFMYYVFVCVRVCVRDEPVCIFILVTCKVLFGCVWCYFIYLMLFLSSVRLEVVRLCS